MTIAQIIRPTDKGVTVFGGADPFRSNIAEPIVFPEGESIEEILTQVLRRSGSPLSLKKRIAAYINDEFVPSEWWPRIRPKSGTVILFRPAPGDTGSLRTVLLFAVIIAGLFAGGILGPLLGGAIGISAGLATSLIGAAVTIGGTLLINALFPIRPPLLNVSGKPEEKSGTQLLSIAGSQNAIDLWGAVPVVLGKNRVYARHAAKPWVYTIGLKQKLKLLLVFGYGKLSVTDIKIGDIPINSFSEWTMQLDSGGSLTYKSLKIYPQIQVSQDLNVEVDEDNEFYNYQTIDNCDEFAVNLFAPNGVFQYNKREGTYDRFIILMDVQWRKVGSGGGWSTLADIGKALGFARSLDPVRTGVSVTLSVRGKYDVRIRKLTPEHATSDDPDVPQFAETVILTNIQSFTHEPPVNFPYPLCMMALDIEATDELTGVIDQINAVCTSVANQSQNGWNSGDTQNPADLFRKVLQHHANARPRTDSQIDLDNLEAWGAVCVSEGRKFNYVYASAKPIYDVLSDIAAAGRASPIFVNGKWGVVYDDPNDEVAWLFTPRNSSNFRSTRVLRDLPHALRVRFINETRLWNQDERIVYNDGYDVNNATLFEQVEFVGVTNPTQIWKDGRFQIAQAKLRPETFMLDVDIEGLRMTRGTKVRVNQDTSRVGLGEARVTVVDGSVITVDETFFFEAGKSYVVRVQKSDGSLIARSVLNTEEETNTFEVVYDSSVPDAGNSLTEVEVGDLLAFGEFSLTTAIYYVTGVTYREDLSATLTLVDEAPDIREADKGAIPVYDPGISSPPDPFDLPPRNLSASEFIVGVGKDAKSKVHVSWEIPRVGRTQKFQLQVKDVDADGGWEKTTYIIAPTLYFNFENLEAGTWAFRVRAVFENGPSSKWTESGDVSIVALLNFPPDVTNFNATVVGDNINFTWDPITIANLSHYQVRYSPLTDGTATWGSSVPFGSDIVADYASFPARVGTYMIKAVTFQGRSSQNSTVAISKVGKIQNVVEVTVQDPDWLGNKIDTIESGGTLRIGTGSVMGDWEFLSDIDSLSGGNQLTDGIYEFDTIIDLSEIYTSRLTASIEASGNDLTDVLDNWPNLDSVVALENADPSDWAVTPQYAVTDDDPSGSPTWSEWRNFTVGDVRGRGFKFRLLLTGTRTVTPIVSKASVTIDMPDRIEKGKDVAVGTGGLRIDFNPPFKVLSSLTTVNQNLLTGDFATVTSKDETGFNILFKNSAGTAVARTLDWTAIGYGRVET